MLSSEHTRESVFLWSLAFTLFKAACLQGRLVQSSGKNLWKFSSWCLVAIKQLLVLILLKLWKSVCCVQCEVGKIVAPDVSIKKNHKIIIKVIILTRCFVFDVHSPDIGNIYISLWAAEAAQKGIHFFQLSTVAERQGLSLSLWCFGLIVGLWEAVMDSSKLSVQQEQHPAETLLETVWSFWIADKKVL